MQVVIRSRGGHLPARLRAVAARKLDRLTRVAPDAVRADVHLAEERNPRVTGRHACSVTVQLRHGSVAAHASAPTREVAIERVLEKLRHQVERKKDRRVRTTQRGAPRSRRRARTPR